MMRPLVSDCHRTILTMSSRLSPSLSAALPACRSSSTLSPRSAENFPCGALSAKPMLLLC
ncbi:hypothetical protein Spb1_39050 [Planctopirus ephydatiae]|uniref:Uncharacterized protein n=1 Tax=Planctopirus ephydatiae TaxID=2528019 RepID=A0A518GTP1_9PLAN|nr:hypothetical protein [Planctopirus ephydatiae]QDV31958.1 hypothetical protein Spb1_39050 [Planctopirus ephydatiae]